MGSYAECWLGDFYVGSSKNDIDPDLMGLFRETDKRVIRNGPATAPEPLKHWLEELDEGEGLPVVYYAAPVPVVRDRLDLLGYTTDNCRLAFDAAAKAERGECQRRLDQPIALDDSKMSDVLRDYIGREYAVLCDLNVDSWLVCLREIRDERLGQDHAAFHQGPLEGTLLGYMLSNGWYGYPGPDRNVALRLALEVCPEAQELVYDITDVIWSGYLEAEEDFVQYAIAVPTAEYQFSAKTVLLTEGKSDAEILSRSLSLLFPHLADYYSFMEFEATRVGGGAGNLANLVKAFAGAGIVSRTIAMFDNDTAAAAALKTLERIKLPSHIKVLRLPNRESLREYPTVGPSGRTVQDVNGVAASLELFLGEDVLRLDEDRAPVQWTGFDTGLHQYQGEVLDKGQIQDRFFEKLEQARLRKGNLDGPEWSDLRAVFECIFSAFHDLDGHRILDDVRAQYALEKAEPVET